MGEERKKHYNLYFSVGWNYKQAYQEVLYLLAEHKSISFTPFIFSQPEQDANGSNKELYRAVRQKVGLCDTVILLSGLYSHPMYSKWIATEIISNQRGV
ncbi:MULTISPECIES: TIR domain-containing protein [Paenibacillus]|uniref:TIR domain-containing protein n=1 Tax=Paenibacillus TaxID=44249 RepID=UPI0022B8B967|nr:TIR domain-containing protein [Paenibacillus caseinilyticus]MCZ8521869.1 hypothetical protein [Paenibacillus caseinilyticus]